MIGTRLGKYEILEEIGKGGMAVVYRGYDSELEREVAVKLLHPHLSAQPESKRRFHREARAVARLRFPNILEIFDYSGRDCEQSYIVTEFIHGGTLRGFLERHPDMPTEVAALVGLEICHGLKHAHENEVIHRDIKPENIMIRDDGLVKITDFGIAQMAGTTQMTVTGQILGSPAHMSPEHVENKPLDFRADIFSMGTLLYWMTTGRLPFEGRNPHAVIKRIVEGDYPDPLRAKPAIGDRMASIIRRCLEVDPENRFASVDQLIEALEAFLRDLGMSPTADELCIYFDAPGDYTERHEQVLIGVLIDRGREERKTRNLSASLDYFNRVLAMDETNEEVLAIIERMSARNRLRRVLEVSAVAITILAALSGLGHTLANRWITDDDQADSGQTVVVISPQNDGGTSTDGALEEAAVVSPPEAGIGPRDGGADASETAPGRPDVVVRRPPQPKRSITRAVRIVPSPPAARIIVDGHDYGEYGRQLASRGIDLSSGPHVVKLLPRDHYYEPAEFTLNVPSVGADGGLMSVARSLRFRPALVRINTNISNATVMVLHRERDRANHVFAVRMNAREEPVQIVVAADGYRSVLLEVVLRAGEEYSRDVDLEPETPANDTATSTTP